MNAKRWRCIHGAIQQAVILSEALGLCYTHLKRYSFSHPWVFKYWLITRILMYSLLFGYNRVRVGSMVWFPTTRSSFSYQWFSHNCCRDLDLSFFLCAHAHARNQLITCLESRNNTQIVQDNLFTMKSLSHSDEQWNVAICGASRSWTGYAKVPCDEKSSEYVCNVT